MPHVGQSYRCSGCNEEGIYPDTVSERYDRYNIYAGLFHDTCWEKSSIRTWTFDPSYAGERLDED